MLTYKELQKKYKVGSVLHCDECGSEYSSDPGDYFFMKPDDTFTCDCDTVDVNPLTLVVRVVSYKKL